MSEEIGDRKDFDLKSSAFKQNLRKCVYNSVWENFWR